MSLAKAQHSVVPPYGQDDLGNLQSIFELAHLKESLTFLDTQCLYLVSILTRSVQLANLALKIVCPLRLGTLYPNTSMTVDCSRTQATLSLPVSFPVVSSM